MKGKRPAWETRTPEQIAEHYRIEKELAARLRHSSRAERGHLYTALYDELFRRVPHIAHVARKHDPRATALALERQLRLLSRFLAPGSTFLEIGAGDCLLSIAVARQVARVYALDVSTEITKDLALPENVELVISDGCAVPLPPESVSVAYSNQVLEHVHPDDVADHLEQLRRALKPGGSYVCITPNRLSGPHDVSRYFEDVPTGFHLREYSATDLMALFRGAGFARVQVLLGERGGYRSVPAWLVRAYEAGLGGLPAAVRRSLTGFRLPRALLTVVVVATK